MITAIELFDSLSALQAVKLGSQEQIILAAVATEAKGATIAGLSLAIHGANTREANVSTRALVNRLKDKGVVDLKYNEAGERLVRLSKDGRELMKKACKLPGK